VKGTPRALSGHRFHVTGIEIEEMTPSPRPESQANRLRGRTKQFALQLLRLWRDLPRGAESDVIGRQLLRSGISLAANYRAACRARSRREFIAKLGITVEECDETLFWLELLQESGLLPQGRLAPLRQEADELVAIFVASRCTAESRQRGPHQR
jgi:four helix bundle protein